MARLQTATSDTKVMNIINEARAILREHDIGWDAVTLRCPGDYVPLSQRHKVRRTHVPSTSPVVAAATAALNGASSSKGVDRSGLLKFVIEHHPEWPNVRDILGINPFEPVSHNDLIAIAQILKIDDSFMQFAAVDSPPEPAVNGQVDLFDNPDE